METKQTAVQWLLEQTMYIRSTKWPDIVEQALEMEKEQIIDAYNSGQQIPPFEYAERFYEGNYGKRNTPISEGVDQPGLPEGRD